MLLTKWKRRSTIKKPWAKGVGEKHCCQPSFNNFCHENVQEFLELVRLVGSCPYGGRHQTHQDGYDTVFQLNYTMIEHCILGSRLPQTHTIR